MQLELEQHEEMFYFTPAIGVTRGDCSNPDCAAVHWRFSIGWLIWSVHLAF